MKNSQPKITTSTSSSQDINFPHARLGMPFDNIPPNLVVSTNPDGTPHSFFKDIKWILLNHRIVITDKVSFSFEALTRDSPKSIANFQTCKLMFSIMVFTENSRSKESRPATLRAAFSTIRKLGIIANDADVTISELISDPSYLEKAKPGFTASKVAMLRIVLKTVCKHAPKEACLTFHPSIMKWIKNRSKRESQAKQTPVIPSRILHTRFQHYMSVINEFDKHSNAIRTLVTELCQSELYKETPRENMKHGKKSSLSKKRAALMNELILKYNLSEHFKVNEIIAPYAITSYLSLVQHSAKCLIHIYSLVREHEAKLLTKDCLTSATGWNKQGIYLLGVSTKLKGSLTDTEWIANEHITAPVATLISVRDIILACAPKSDAYTDYLFLTPSLLPISRNPSGNTIIKDNMYRHEHKLPAIIITEKDMRELTSVDPLGDWQTDRKFSVGKPWPFRSHQFRRTMAVFAAQSDLLELPDLKRLLTHIRELMSIHYQKGCSAGGYKMSDKCPELIKEYTAELNNAEMLTYLKDVIYSDEPLLGVHGRKVQAHKDADPTRFSVFKQTAEQTLKKIKSGLLAWQRTPIGGCTSTKPCDNRAHCNFTECIGCSESVINIGKIENVIQTAKIDLKDIPVNSFEYRAEERNIKDYESLLNKIKRK